MTLRDRDSRLERCGGMNQNQIHYGETEGHVVDVDDECEMMMIMKLVVVMMIYMMMMMMIMKVVVIIGALYND